jgi:hypothetical protein
MKNLPKEKRDRLVLVIIGTLVILVAFWMGLLGPQRRGLNQALKKASEQASQVSNAERLTGMTSQLERNLLEANGRLLVLERTMASGDMYSWIIQTMNRFKDGYKVEIPHFSREAPTEVGMFAKFPYRAVVFNLRGYAYYHELGRFIADFENVFPHIRVQRLDLEPSFNPNTPESTSTGSGDDPEKLGFRMEIVVLVNPNSP